MGFHPDVGIYFSVNAGVAVLKRDGVQGTLEFLKPLLGKSGPYLGYGLEAVAFGVVDRAKQRAKAEPRPLTLAPVIAHDTDVHRVGKLPLVASFQLYPVIVPRPGSVGRVQAFCHNALEAHLHELLEVGVDVSRVVGDEHGRGLYELTLLDKLLHGGAPLLVRFLGIVHSVHI